MGLSRKLPKIKRNDLLFFISYGMYMFFSVLYTSFYLQYFNTAYVYVLLLCMGLLFIREAFQSKHTLKTIGIAIFFVITMLLIMITASDFRQIACVFAYVFCARNIEFKKIAKFTLIITVPLIIFIVLSSYIGIIENHIDDADGRNRVFLGFRYALYGSTFMFNITALYVYIKKEKIRFLQALFLLAVNYFFYAFTDSRLTFMLSVVLILSALVMKRYSNMFEKHKFIGKVLCYSFVLTMIFSFVTAVCYDGTVSWQKQINSFLSHRISLGKAALEEYGVPLLGNEIEWVGNGLDAQGDRKADDLEYNYVDCLYIKVLVNFGLIFLALYVLLHTYAMLKWYQRKDYYLLIILCLIALHGFIDDLPLLLHYNTFWLVIGFWFKKRNDDIVYENLQTDTYKG